MSETNVTAADLRRHFPDIEQLFGRRFLLKYGGAAMEVEATKQLVCSEVAALSQLGVQIVVVHGGGKDISRLLERLGLTSRFVDGLRVTDDEVMLATEMVLSGAVNSDLVSRITRCGSPAVGLTGRDARLLTARPIVLEGGQSLGRTGEVEASDPTVIERTLSSGFVPVVSPVGEDREGRALNLNADYAAAALAGSSRAEVCVFLTDVPGVKKDGAVLPELTKAEVANLIQSGVISGGMVPKVECAVRALNAGCPRAVVALASRPYVLTASLLGAADCGTVIG